MTWVTVQSHDIGDTFPGIYALEKVFGVGARVRLVLALRTRAIVRVVVWSFWDQSQERLQWWQRYRAGGVKALGMRASAASRGKSIVLFGDAVGQSAPARPRWGAKKLRRLLKELSPAARSGGEHLGALAGELHLVRKRKRRARRGPVLPRRAVHAVKGCNQMWTIDFKGWFARAMDVAASR